MKPHERGGSALSHLFFIPRQAGKVKKRGVKNGGALQIHNVHNFFGLARDCALYQAKARPADVADRPGVTTATIYRELKRGETVGEDGASVLHRNWRRGLRPGCRPAEGNRQISGGGAGLPRTACKEVSTVTQFEKITESPETLGAFLAALPVVDGPWDTEFHKRFCAGCAAAEAWGKLLSPFNPQIIAAVEIPQILTTERGGAE